MHWLFSESERVMDIVDEAGIDKNCTIRYIASKRDVGE